MAPFLLSQTQDKRKTKGLALEFRVLQSFTVGTIAFVFMFGLRFGAFRLFLRCFRCAAMIFSPVWVCFAFDCFADFGFFPYGRCSLQC
jgi:hypothetical protein